MQRRDVLFAAGCAATLAGAEWLRPRQRLVLMPKGERLATLFPRQLPGWEDAGGGDIVIPRTEGSLQARLYSDQLARAWQRAGDLAGAGPTMLLAAYGTSQSDALQLHRPEVCYPASGFEISAPRPLDLALSGGARLPAVSLTARFGSRIEDIVYWTRLGEALPRTEGEQRRARFEQALDGVVGDGILVRLSAVRDESQGPRFEELAQLARILVDTVSPGGRAAVVGTEISRTIP